MKSLKSNHLTTKIIVGVFALAAIGLTAWYFNGRLSVSSIIFEAIAVSELKNVGVPFDIDLVLENDSDNFLKDVSFSLILPAGAVLANGEDRRIASIDIGEVKPGEIKEESFSVVIVDAIEGQKEFTAGVSYSIGSLTATFERSATVSVSVGQFPLTLDITSPEKVFSGEEFEAAVKYENSGDRLLPAFRVKLARPRAYILTSSQPKQLGDGWEVDTLVARATGEIKFKGSASLPDDSKLDMAVQIFVSIGEREYMILEKPFQVVISQSPLSVSISLVDDKQSYGLEERMSYIISYQNNTSESFKGAVLTAKLVGTMYDFKSLDVDDARFNSSTKTITWSGDKLRSLDVIGPGEGGNVSFSIKVVDTYPIKKLNDKNFTVRVDAGLQSPTVSGGVSAGKTVASDSHESKISGMVEVDAAGLFRDAVSLILNSGPWPPRTYVPTEFTIHWKLTNFSTDVSSVEVRAALPEGVVFTGKTKSTMTTTPTLDSKTGEVVWKIGRLFATAGITTKNPEAIFQVKVTPTIAGDYAQILEETVVTAKDDFTGAELKMSAEPVTTRLPDDTSVAEGEGIVQN